MARAIHRFQPHFLLLLTILIPPFHTEHVLCIVLPVARLLPERLLVYYRCDDLLEAKLWVLRAQEGLQLLEDICAVGQDEWRARAIWRCYEQVVRRCECAVVESGDGRCD